jgi:hypothetical protein
MKKYKIEVYDSDKVFIPYVNYKDQIIPISTSLIGDIDPFNKIESMKKWESLDSFEASIGLPNGEIFLARK